jgi:hypothetical protein
VLGSLAAGESPRHRPGPKQQHPHVPPRSALTPPQDPSLWIHYDDSYVSTSGRLSVFANSQADGYLFFYVNARATAAAAAQQAHTRGRAPHLNPIDSFDAGGPREGCAAQMSQPWLQP